MPVSESWGTLGWGYQVLDSASAKFNELCRIQRQGHSQPKGITASASKPRPGVSGASKDQNAPNTP